MIRPVRAEVWVAASPDAAYRRFTRGIGSWWPGGTHSVSGPAFHGVRFVAPTGDRGPRLIETDAEDRACPWAEVLTWQPGSSLVLAWHPGRGLDEAQDLELRFVAEGEGTRVHLLHTRWHAAGPAGPELREAYAEAWPRILRCYKASFHRDPDRRPREEVRPLSPPPARLDGVEGRGYAVVESLASLATGSRLTGLFRVETEASGARALEARLGDEGTVTFEGTAHHRDRSGRVRVQVRVTRVELEVGVLLVEFAGQGVPPGLAAPAPGTPVTPRG